MDDRMEDCTDAHNRGLARVIWIAPSDQSLLSEKDGNQYHHRRYLLDVWKGARDSESNLLWQAAVPLHKPNIWQDTMRHSKSRATYKVWPSWIHSALAFAKEPEPITENNSITAYWDVPVFAENKEVRANRIDARIVDKVRKEIILLEMSCPWTTNRRTKEEEKTRKYVPLWYWNNNIQAMK